METRVVMADFLNGGTRKSSDECGKFKKMKTRELGGKAKRGKFCAGPSPGVGASEHKRIRKRSRTISVWRWHVVVETHLRSVQHVERATSVCFLVKVSSLSGHAIPMVWACFATSSFSFFCCLRELTHPLQRGRVERSLLATFYPARV